ncbi:MAG: hypothetical protein JOZ39_00990, partial [Chloroflexi bacterium]|nr:hypothetical protein [Chloroflexota bacterium]
NLGFPALAASSGLLVGQLGAVVGRMAWGRLSDRAFRGMRRPVLARVAILAGLAIASLALTSGFWPLWAVYVQLAIVGGTALGWNGLAVTMMAELGGAARAGAAIGLNSAAVYLGALVAAPAFGAIVDLSHSYRIGFLALAAAILCALAPMALVRENQQLHQPALITP